MSVVPLMLRDLFEELSQPQLFDQHFGLGIVSDDLLHPRTSTTRSPRLTSYYRPRRHIRGPDSGVSSILSNDNEFKVNLDVQQFKPQELSVKTVGEYIVVEGKHEERRDDHGFITRQFQRRYLLPDTVDSQAVCSALSSDGVLTISAPKKALPAPDNQRDVPIIETQQPAIKASAKSGKQGEGDKMEQ